MIRHVSPLVPASPFRNGDPPPKNAELTIYALGPDQDEIIPCLRMLGDFTMRELRRIQGALPVTLVLPRAYYDKSDAFVSLLRTTGTRFTIVSYAWVCPDEVKDDVAGKTSGLHWCTSTCPVLQIEETISS